MQNIIELKCSFH